MSSCCAFGLLAVLLLAGCQTEKLPENDAEEALHAAEAEAIIAESAHDFSTRLSTANTPPSLKYYEREALLHDPLNVLDEADIEIADSFEPPIDPTEIPQN